MKTVTLTAHFERGFRYRLVTRARTIPPISSLLSAATGSPADGGFASS
jgi:hypothetical protein